MSRSALLTVFALGIALCGCVTDSQPSPNVTAAQRRELTPAEKQMISRDVAATMKDPDAAKFMWVPLVLVSRDGITDYCGLVNGKNAYGGYVGFDKFYVQLHFEGTDPHGKLTDVSVQLLANAADDVSQGTADTVCGQYGYGTLAEARS